jgi:hypothetical protein
MLILTCLESKPVGFILQDDCRVTTCVVDKTKERKQ